MSFLEGLVEVRGNLAHVQFSPEWSVRSMFGGALAAAAVRAVRAVIGDDLILCDGLFAYLAPTPPGAAIIEVTAHRVSRHRATASVSIRSGGVSTVQGMLTLARRPRPADPLGGSTRGRPPLDAPVHRAFGGCTEWVPLTPPAATGAFHAWVRATGAAASLPDDEWICIATDILGPAIASTRSEPFAVATTTLSITVLASGPASSWQRQRVIARLHDGAVAGELELRNPGGALAARARQHAVLLEAAGDDLPRSITAFADSAHGSLLIGGN